MLSVLQCGFCAAETLCIGWSSNNSEVLKVGVVSQYQGQYLWTSLDHPAASSVHLEVPVKAGLAVLPDSSAAASPANTIRSSFVDAAQ